MSLQVNPSPSRVASRTAPRAPAYTQSQVAASLAANPNASKGGYEGPPIGEQYPGQNAPANAPATDPYSVDGDPILAKIRAGNETARTNARAGAQASAKALAIRFGDASGISTDQNAQAEASGNPYSTLATLLKNYHDTGLAHDESLNNQNLFYSGTRAKTLTEDAGTYQHGVYDARNAALDAYGGIQSGLASALSGADQSDTAGLTDAYGRAGQRAATYGYDPGASTPPPPAGTPPPPSGTTTAPPTIPGGLDPAIATAVAAQPSSLAAALAKAAQAKLVKIPVG